MKFYLYKCTGCDVIKAMSTFNGEELVFVCSVCTRPKHHYHLYVDEADMCEGTMRTGPTPL